MEYTRAELEALHAVETEILISYIDICKKLNLRYYLIGGTLIGAIRHQGFIPWDDDIDIGMPREDYEIFLKEAQALLPEHLFVQTIWTDREYLQCFAKIRNSNTTFLETTAAKHNINHGAFIDIFPLDYYPDDPKAQRRIDKKRSVYTARVSARYARPTRRSPQAFLLTIALRLIYPSYRYVLKKRDKLFKSIPKSRLLANYGGFDGQREIVPASWYGQGVPVTFEGLQVIAPTQYHEILTHIYGDYMQLPPEEDRVGHHYTDVLDLKTPYTAYIKQNR